MSPGANGIIITAIVVYICSYVNICKPFDGFSVTIWFGNFLQKDYIIFSQSMSNDKTHDLFSVEISGFIVIAQTYGCRLNTSALWGSPVKACA